MDEQLERTKIAELTTEIVAAYVSHHQLRVLDVPNDQRGRDRIGIARNRS